MSLYVLDTDMLSLYQRGDTGVCARCEAQPSDNLAVTVISVEEQLSGWYTLLRRAKKPQQLAQVYQRMTATVRFLSRLQILSFDEPAIAVFEQLRGLRLRIGAMDVRIAAITRTAGGILVTRNVSDFQQVPNLVIENWSV